MKAAFARLKKDALKASAFTQHLHAIYFDTAKDDLHAKGLSFRIREENGRWIQTLKQSAADAEALTRGEWSDDVAAAAPELLNTQSGRKLRQVWKDLRLLPRFSTTVTRHGFVLHPRRGAAVEVVRDDGDVRAVSRDDEATPISEIELELKAGAPGALYDVALRLVAAGVFQIETRAKADRGYALLGHGGTPAAVKAEAPEIQGRDTLAEVLRLAARRHFGQFLANRSGALAQDPDSIHQMRVAMRRLRSVLYAVRDLLPETEYEAVRMKLKYLLQSLGDARDWEVLTERLSGLEKDGDVGARAERVRRAAASAKKRALSRAVDAVESRKTTQTMLEVMRWFEDLPTARYARKLKAPAKEAAVILLSELFERVRRRGRHFEEQSVGERHRLRISCKNLRYNVELFGGLYGKRKAEKFLAQLKPVQDDLGHLNDVSRARDLLGELAKRAPHKAAAGAGAVIKRLENDVPDADKRARKHVASLRNAKPFW